MCVCVCLRSPGKLDLTLRLVSLFISFLLYLGFEPGVKGSFALYLRFEHGAKGFIGRHGSYFTYILTYLHTYLLTYLLTYLTIETSGKG